MSIGPFSIIIRKEEVYMLEQLIEINRPATVREIIDARFPSENYQRIFSRLFRLYEAGLVTRTMTIVSMGNHEVPRTDWAVRPEVKELLKK